MANPEAAAALHDFCRALDGVSNAWNDPEHYSWADKVAAESKFAAALERVRPLIPAITECRPGGTLPAFHGRILECIDTAKKLSLFIWTVSPTGTPAGKCEHDLQQQMRDGFPALFDELGKASSFLAGTAAHGKTGKKTAGRPKDPERERIRQMYLEGGEDDAIAREFPHRSAADMRKIKSEAKGKNVRI